MNIGPIELTNTVSGVVLGALLIVVGGIAWLLREIYKTRSASEDARNEASRAVTTSSTLSNDIACNINAKLDHQTKVLDKLQHSINTHLQWHMENEK